MKKSDIFAIPSKINDPLNSKLKRMKYLYSIILTLSLSLGFAQSDLYVSNGSYVYVDGTGFTSGPTTAPLFVTDDININTTGHIYLRNGAQLLQSTATTTSTNSGNGKLSVHQTGTSNTYMYNYWCSPVGINSGSAGNTVFTPNVNFYYETSAPINSTAFGYITGYNGTTTQIANYWLYTFTGTTAPPNEYQDWEGLGAGPGSLATGGLINGTLASGYGFTMKGNPSSAQKYDFRGRPNNGTISTTLNANRETLVGNPYPSALDAHAFIHDSNNATIINSATLSFWEQDPANSNSHVLVNYVGGYATYTINLAATMETFIPATFDTYNVDGTLNTTGGSSTSGKNVYRYIPVGQGFMVRGNGTGGTLRATNAMRIFQKEAATLSEFFKSGNHKSGTEDRYNDEGLFIVPDDFMRFRLNIDFNETYTRQLMQNFHHTATAGEDYGLETISPAALESDAYWPLNDKAFNAQAFNFDLDLRIPLVINTQEDQSIRFRVFDIQNFEADQPIYIHDIETDTYVNLRSQNYEINLEQGNHTDRFEIVFRSEALSTEDIVSNSAFDVFQDNSASQLVILNPDQLDVTAISVFDVSGKRVYNKEGLATQDRYTLSTKHLSSGVYITSIVFADQNTIHKKVIVSK